MPSFASILLFLLIGALAGWLAGKLLRGRGFGLIANVLIGILGGMLGGLIFDWLDLTTGSGFLWSLLVALVGAVALVFAVGLLGRLIWPRR